MTCVHRSYSSRYSESFLYPSSFVCPLPLVHRPLVETLRDMVPWTLRPFPFPEKTRRTDPGPSRRRTDPGRKDRTKRGRCPPSEPRPWSSTLTGKSEIKEERDDLPTTLTERTGEEGKYRCRPFHRKGKRQDPHLRFLVGSPHFFCNLPLGTQ